MAITPYVYDLIAADGRKHFDSELDTALMSFANNADRVEQHTGVPGSEWTFDWRSRLPR